MKHPVSSSMQPLQNLFCDARGQLTMPGFDLAAAPNPMVTSLPSNALTPRQTTAPEQLPVHAATSSLPALLRSTGLTEQELAEDQDDADEDDCATRSSNRSPAQRLNQLLLRLRRQWLPRQNDFGFQMPPSALRIRYDHQLYALQEQLVEGCADILRDTRTTARVWLQEILWLLDSSQTAGASNPLSFRMCCLALSEDYEEARERVLQWIAAPLLPAQQAPLHSFQARCVRERIDPAELGQRILRCYAPALDRTLQR